MKLNKLARSLALIGLGTQLAGLAFAQTPPVKVERVEITGSSIKRIQDEGALPLQVITRDEIERAGIVSAEQLIMSLNINGNGMDNLASNADVVAGSSRGNNGATSANLRGQGASSTLVLLNGRRVAAHGLNGGAVDLNSIPFAAVERVEVLKDGASAIYGTDAIGGVINFILKKNFTGLQLNTLADITAGGGGNIYRHSLVGGFGDLDKNGFNVLATLSFSDNKILRGDQRDFVNTFQVNRGLSVDTRGTPHASVFAIAQLDTILSRKSSTGPIQPGTTQQMGGGINVLDLPGQAGCTAMDGGGPYDEALWSVPSAKWACAWDTGRAAVIQQPVKNTNLVTRGTVKLGDHLLSAELVRGKSESAKSFSHNQISTSGVTTSATYNVVWPSTGANYDFVFGEIAKVFPSIAGNKGLPIAFRWRCMACGTRELTTESDTGRLLLSMDGPLWGNWDYKAGVSSAFSKSESTAGTGYHYQTELMNLIKDGILNPFLKPGEQQTDAAMKALQAISAEGVKLYGGEYNTRQVDFSASGPVFKLPAGEVMAAIGADVRQEDFTFAGDTRTDRRPVYNLAFDNANTLNNKVKRTIKAFYGEVLVPITKELELTGAVRRDDYTGFGVTTNPKVSLRFAPIKQLALRGSYSTGFRVPTFNQMFNGITESPYSGKDLVDPNKCAGGKVDATVPGCESVTFNYFTGGKLDLGPEESKQYSAGIIFSPTDNLVATLDWWSIQREGTIQSLALSTLFANYKLFPDRFLYNNGVLTFVDDRWINAGETSTKGLEFGLRHNANVGGGKLSTGLDISYLLEKKSRLLASQPFGASEIGRFTRSGDLGIRWKHSAFVTYAQGDWSGTLTQQYRGGYLDYVLPGVASGAVKPPEWNARVNSYLLHHASVTYKGIKNLSLSVGIKNIFNEDPPFSAAYDSDTGAGSSWEPRVADPRGRSYNLAATYTFW